MEIIIGRQGNQKMPITDPTVSKQHCKVTAGKDGSFIVENLSSSYTKVDGKEIIRTQAKPESILQLGPQFKAPLGQLLGMDKQNADDRKGVSGGQRPPQGNTGNAGTPEKIYNIAHLKRIWEDFEQSNIEIAEKQRKINLTRTGLGIFTMCAMPTIFFLGPVGYVLTGIGVIGNVFSFIGMKNSESAADRKRRQDAFDDAWVCPNPQCGRTLAAKNYKLLKRNFQVCPFCKVKYVEKI